MKYVDEFRDPQLAKQLVAKINGIVTKPWAIMEMCGGQTHAIMHYGIDQLLPPEIELIHGPGCPVCVTPLKQIDKALAIAKLPNVIFTSYGDMLRVPGTKGDLFSIRGNGGDVRIVYSPLDALKIAKENPDKEVVFFAIGFETTAPANAMSVMQAKALGIKNFSVLVSHVLVPPAINAILDSERNRVQGFLAAGHVCAIMGFNEYFQIADDYHVPVVVTGFEPLDLLNGIYRCIKQLEASEAKVENAYPRTVTQEGNLPAQKVLNRVFDVCDRNWRGIGTIPQSGWTLSEEFKDFDAEIRFDVGEIRTQEPEICIAGEIMQGFRKPHDCPAFGTLCTPKNPLGATMVSDEGVCSAYYRYKKTA